MTTTIEVPPIRPARMNVPVTEGDAWTLGLVLSRGGTPIDLTSATVTTRFRSNDGGEEMTLTYTATNLAAGAVSIGQAAGTSGRFAVVVTESGATPRTMIKGDILAERVL